MDVDNTKISKLFQLHLHDARDISACVKNFTTAKNVIDVTITSPPYHDIIKYGDVENQVGYGQEYGEYKDDLSLIFKQLFDLTKKNGSLWIIVDSYSKNKELIPLPFELISKMSSIGWILKNIFVWKKDKTRPWAHKGQVRKIFEYILFFVKSQDFKFYVDRIRELNLDEYKEWWVKYPERYNPKGRIPTNIWEYPIPVQGSWRKEEIRHSNPLPVGLIHRILILVSNKNNVVCDPFSGTGTVLATANALGRKCIGFELNETYVSNYNEFIKDLVKKEVEEIQAKNANYKRQQRKLSNIIKDLRIVKFPKSVFKTMINIGVLDNDAKEKINTIYSIKTDNSQERSKNNRTVFASKDLFFVFDDEPPLIGEDEINELLSEREVRRFQIFSKIHFCSINDMATKKFVNDNIALWLYKPKRIYKINRKISVKEWIIECRKEHWKKNFYNYIPPIISNVKVNQKIRKTWKSNEEIKWLQHKQFQDILNDDWINLM